MRHEFHEFTLNDPATDSSLMQFAGIRGINAFVAMNKGFKCLPNAFSELNLSASNDSTTWLQCHTVRDNSCRYGFAPTIRYETMTELTQQRTKQLKTSLTD